MVTLHTPTQTANANASVSFQRYYEEAGPDYAAWSPHFNMHFGFYRWGMNPFRREAMLEQMNMEVLNRLHRPTASSAVVSARVLDMGCGLGATLRSFARHLPHSDLSGITLVPWQLERGRQLNQACPNAETSLSLSEITNTPHCHPLPSTLSARLRVAVTPKALTNLLSSRRRTVSSAQVAASS